MLELENIHAYYGPSHVLHGVSMTVRPGEVACLLGRNGAGKTTTMLATMGYLPPLPGTVRFKGQDISGWAPHRVARLGFGFVPQERGIFPSLTVRENLTTTARGGPGARWTLDSAFRLFPRLQERQGNLGHQLSGGEQQMLSIARALMLNPSVLLLDEPSEGIAPLIVAEIMQVIRHVRDEGMAVLLIEQNLGAALEVGDRYHVMSKGQICFSGTRAQLEADAETMDRHLAVAH
jgi:branched-chain amino acid transport system ATP-binding protein